MATIKKKVTTYANPNAAAVRSQLLAEADLVKESEFGLPELRQKQGESRNQYRQRYLAGFDLPDIVRKRAEEATPDIKLDRAGLEAKYNNAANNDPKSGGYLDGATRRALVDMEFGGAREYLGRVTDKVGRLYDKTTESAKGALDDVNDEVATAESRFGTRLSRAQQLSDSRRQRQEQIEDRNYAAARSGSSSGGLTLLQGLENPLAVFLANGGRRVQKQDGGFDYFDPKGKPISVEQAASMVPGGTKSAFLSGSAHKQDANFAYDKNQKAAIGQITDNIRQDPDVKDFVTVRDYYERIKSGAASKSGVGDLSLIFSYMKVLDPTSVVRETEYKNAADAVGKLSQLSNVPRQYVKGTKLTEQGRKWFLEEAAKIYSLKQAQNQRALSSYRGAAAAYGIDPDIVLRDYSAGGSDLSSFERP